MPADPQPPALASLVDFAERPRVHDWSLRASLVRYAQPQPQRVNDLLELVRRIESTLGRNTAVLERDGPALWDAMEDTAPSPTAPHAQLVGLLRATRELDDLGDALAAWAVNRSGVRPDAEVDRAIASVAQQLDALGIPREERAEPPARRRRRPSP